MIHISDWETSNTFYREVVGVELVSKKGRWAYRFENAQLNLHGPGVEAHPLARIPVPPGGSDLCFEWIGPIGEAVNHLKTHGIKIELGPVARPVPGVMAVGLFPGSGWIAPGVYLVCGVSLGEGGVVSVSGQCQLGRVDVPRRGYRTSPGFQPWDPSK